MSYVNVKTDPTRLDEMLRHSKGARRVPVLVTSDGKVTVGFGGS